MLVKSSLVLSTTLALINQAKQELENYMLKVDILSRYLYVHIHKLLLLEFFFLKPRTLNFSSSIKLDASDVSIELLDGGFSFDLSTS